MSVSTSTSTSEINSYKQYRISEQTRIFNENVSRLYSALVFNVNNTRKMRMSTQSKDVKINRLNAQYTHQVGVLKSTLEKNILAIQAYVPKQIVIRNKKRALLIGINYTGTTNELYGCVNDALAIQERLQRQQFDSIQLLTNTSATKKNILKEFQQLLTSSNEGDMLFFLYSGHGSYDTDRNGDEQTGYDQLIIPNDSNPIRDDELKTMLQLYLKPNVTLFAMFDSCFSGSVLDLKYQYLDSLNYDTYTENPKQLNTKGTVFMISGCSDIQTSADAFINGKASGAMTWSLLEALKQSPTTSWRELLKTMRNLLKTSNYDQVPQLSCGNFENIDLNVFI
jgi:hypothetical protein